MSDSPFRQGEFLIATYEIDGSASTAQMMAERICFDHTIEAEADLLPHVLQSEIVGQVQNLQQTAGGRYEATIQYRGELLSGDCTDLLNVLFGTSSLRGNVRLLSFTMTDRLLSSCKALDLALNASSRSSLFAPVRSFVGY